MKIRLFVTAATLLLVCTATDVFSVSPAVKSTQDYAFTLDTIRQLRIMVENFGDEQMKKKYSDIKVLFQEAGENYYGQDFTNSALKFKKVKMELISMLETIDDLYLKRTKEILDSTSKDSFDTLIEYTKQSGLGQYFARPYDPIRDVKPYESDKFHLFYDRQKIENYLREGYKKYQKAKNLFEDPEIAIMRKRDNLTVKNINYIIKSYSDVVFMCREAKQNGIEIHKVKNINELGKSLVKYDITHGTVIPIYDDRIPEKYKVDANDNIRLIHAVEMKKLQKQTGSKQG